VGMNKGKIRHSGRGGGVRGGLGGGKKEGGREEGKVPKEFKALRERNNIEKAS